MNIEYWQCHPVTKKLSYHQGQLVDWKWDDRYGHGFILVREDFGIHVMPDYRLTKVNGGIEVMGLLRNLKELGKELLELGSVPDQVAQKLAGIAIQEKEIKQVETTKKVEDAEKGN